MAFTATLESVERAGDPTRVIINVTYRDETQPDWRVTKPITITLDPALSNAQQKAAIQNAVKADASPYFRQNQVVLGLLDLAGQSIPITG